jgi:DNA ligase-1
MLFREFSQICEKLEGISGRLEMIDLISRILPGLSDDELTVFVRFIMGRIFPDWSPQKLGIGTNLLFEGIAYVAGTRKEIVIGTINETGDPGKAVEILLAGKEQTSFFSEDLEIVTIYHEFEKIAGISGKNSQREKLLVVRKLLANASPLEGRYLTRIMLEDLRIGVGEGNIREAVAKGFSVESALVEHAMQALNDMGVVAQLARKGESSLRDVHISLFHPVRMMLAQQGTISSAITENGTIAAEYKYDGNRFQFHKTGTTSRMYSRKLEDVTNALPDVLDILNASTIHDVILDGEVIAIKDGRPLPFQNVLRRFRRKHDIGEMTEEIRLIPNVFDILYLDRPPVDREEEKT